MTLVLDLEQASAYRHGDAHDYRFTHTCDVIYPAMQCSIEQMVCCLFKRGEHENTVLHLGDAKSGDAQHLSLRHKHMLVVFFVLSIQEHPPKPALTSKLGKVNSSVYMAIPKGQNCLSAVCTLRCRLMHRHACIGWAIDLHGMPHS